MENIAGISVSQFPFELKERVGVLLFPDFPTTIVYSTINGDPIIKEWVDIDEERKWNRFFYYKPDLYFLKGFINLEISHLDLINSAKGEVVIFQDEYLHDVRNTTVTSIREINKQYLPEVDMMIDADSFIGSKNIYEYFKLKLVNRDKEVAKYIKDISQKTNFETLLMRIKKGKGVGVGRINTETYGKTLLHLHKLYKNTALDYKIGRHRGDVDIEAKKNQKFWSFAQTEVFANAIAASYGIVVKPIVTNQLNLHDDETDTQQVISRVFNLINNSSDLDLLKNEYNVHSLFTIHAYKFFLESVLKLHLEVELKWVSPFNKKEYNTDINPLKASTYLMNFASIAIPESTKFNVKGKFRAIHCDTRHYNFVSIDDSQYIGYFDKLIKDSLPSINFQDIYEIVIQRTEIRETEDLKAEFEDIIIACLPVD